MSTKARRICSALVVLALTVGCFNVAQAAGTSLCLATGYTFGFFNGVRSTPVQAADSLAALRGLKGATFNTEPVQYEAFYNHTGSSAGGTSLEDIAAIFEQRAAAIDSTGELGRRWELFWENLTGERTLTQQILGLFPSAANSFSQIYTDISASIGAGATYLLSHPPTEAAYASQNIRLDALALQQQKLMLVTHSDGNLFANHAYNHVVQRIGSATSIAVVQVGPAASLTLTGGYLLADIDSVVNGVRVQGSVTVPAVNISLSASGSDLSGHSFTGTYLDPSRAGRASVDSLISTALQTVTSPLTGGSVGSFTVTLTWNGAGDVDLHTFEPNGAHAYYDNRAGVVGFLDIDNTTANGPEHYFASCDANVLQPGRYHVGINNYADATGRTATVQVSSSRGGTLLTRTLDVGPELGPTGNMNPLPVLDVIVTKDPATGVFSFSAN